MALLIKHYLANIEHRLNKFIIQLDSNKNFFLAYMIFFIYQKYWFIWPNFTIRFLSDYAIKQLKLISINYHAINLVKNKQILYSLIYNLELIKLEKL